MLSVLIVDDEPLFLDSITGMIDWGANGARMIGTASNGLKAMNVLSSADADVVITDIRMPVMDGLELICRAQEQNPDAQFVVLSAYSDFAMVREAYMLGAREYILKAEVSPEQLVGILARCAEKKAKIEERKQNEARRLRLLGALCRKSARLKGAPTVDESIIVNALFNAMLDGDGETGRALLAYAREAGVRNMRVMLVKTDAPPGALQSMGGNDRRNLERALTGIIREITADYPCIAVFCRTTDEYVILLPAREEGLETARAVHKAVSDGLRTALFVDAVVSVSSHGPVNEGLKTLYEQARAAMDGLFTQGRRSLLVYRPDGANDPEDARFCDALKALADSFGGHLSAGRTDKLLETLDAYKITGRVANRRQRDEAKRQFRRYFARIGEYVDKNGSCGRADALLSYFREYLSAFGTLGECNEWLEDILTALHQMTFSAKNLTVKVKRYVAAHYGEEISLTALARHMGVHPNHLSRFFSQKEGESLTSYINHVRVQAAMRLLRCGNMKVYEIAYSVGYRSTEHFTRMFKKFVGKSPSSYAK